MKRKRRTEILINGSEKLAAKLADEIISRYEVIQVEEPNDGLVMVKVRESAKRSLFYIGEVLVTECKVRIHDSAGIGIVAGHKEELAFHLAVIDAAYQARLKETKDWDKQLLEEEKAIKSERVKQMAHVMKTKVDFETMDIS
ncbi:phosphonate C-P lyase system protein PhnG [Bacillus thermotolerans]|uniref:Phosphonate C-P lyase system protein PhnG n=1 Tax=Bacillus thermotolerans TaxID=1221996 RepID=A0A0F5I5A2_BACTR|nr:phosphonate C-P lyase system protein PhnG [Bacillus thermotolerans]KKB38050.1 hypothetical protein QY97_03425 [Bacillus thermotolerans]KKB40711.1 hypothetical protein QY95_01285 [Bacillus thermotolerans]